MRKAGINWLGYSPALIIGLGCGIAIIGSLSMPHGHDMFWRMWTQRGTRLTGPLKFRFVLQPVIAVIMAIRDGIKDARTGRSPYFWTVITNRAERVGRLREGLKATSRIIVLAIVMDAIFQVIVFKAFYPGEAVIIALTLAFLPYLLIRGPAARIAGWWRR